MSKVLTVTRYKTVPEQIESPIEKVVHGLPTWMFPSGIFSNNLEEKCPICRQEMNMNMNIAHGQYITTCSFIETKSGYKSPIHTACYEAIGTDNKNVNHFEYSGNILVEIHSDKWKP